MEAEIVLDRSHDDWIEAGVILNSHHDHKLAEKALYQALNLDPFNSRAIDQLILSFQNQGQFEQALRCAKVLVRYNDSPYSQYRLAEIYYLLQEDELALNHYRNALQMSEFDGPLLFEIYKNSGNIYVRLGDFDSAQEFYDKAFTLNAQSAPLLVNYGTLELQRENVNEARDRFRAAIEVDPTSDKAWVGLSLIHRQFGDFAISRANLEKALDLLPTNKTALKIYVEWSVNDGEFDKALQRIDDYLAVGELSDDIVLMNSQILWCKGKIAEAQLELSHALLINPESEAAQKYLEFMRGQNV